MNSKQKNTLLKSKTLPIALSLLFLVATFFIMGLQSCSKEDTPVNKEPLFLDILVDQNGWNSIRVRGRIQKGEEKIVQTGLAVANTSDAHITECATTILNSDLPIDITVNRMHTPASYVRLYAITSNNVYYSEEFILREATSLVIPYQGTQLHVAHLYTEKQMRWDLPPYKLEGANDSFDGRPNQQTLLINSGNFDAAKYCEGLVYGGYSDWYLPAAAELAAMVENKVVLDMPSLKYWSSTEQNEEKAYLSNTSINFIVPANKDTYAACRCIRRD
ncbi:MAG: DUF1566 domain-containing protein [Bacteroidetes bacterium]|nr:MAG: DUF1566 domain-containing protein [Bacteroidota bacterium]